jgi:dextranase
MRRQAFALIGVMLFILTCSEGILVAQQQPDFDLVPDKTFYRPGDVVTLNITASEGVRSRVVISALADVVGELEVDLTDGTAALSWQPPATALRGYGVDAQLLDASGKVIAEATTAFDVLDRWIQAPRYGFLSDFGVGRDNYDETQTWLLKHHINGLQFYDWQYRWENLVPETDVFDDGLGRPQSMTTINQLIETAHAVNTAAMPYTAIYGASLLFSREHETWALNQSNDEMYLFANLLGIMDPSPGSPWNTHLMNEFSDVLEKTTFDGIHIDQYGAPRNGYNEAGEFVELKTVMPLFIDQAAEIVQQKRGDEGVVIFNSVGNWPVETVAPADQDAVYIEVWPPQNDYADLYRIVTGAQTLGGQKPVIIAAYIDPRRTINWRLSSAVIFASGAYHLETGEPDSMLADPYFPKYGRLDAKQRDVFENTYDFVVRYENVLALNTVAASNDRLSAVDLGEIRTKGLRAINRVMPVMRVGEGFETLSLINFVGLDEASWNKPAQTAPTPFTDVTVTLTVERPVTRVWWTSPDNASLAAQSLDFRVEGNILTVTVPSLNYWSMVVVEYENVQ